MKKLIISAPMLSASGYGECSRFALRALCQHEDKFDIYVNILNWGATGFLFDENEEYEFIKSLRVKTDFYNQQTGGKPQYDISLQITIPNEWKRMAITNIGYTAGIETHMMSPAWFEPCQQMDKIITISEFAKNVITGTIFTDQQKNQHKVTTPVEVVHFPFVEALENSGIDLELPCHFNFLTINQWGPRKNMEFLISNFIDEFRNEDVGLVIKTNIANDSTLDKLTVEQKIQSLVASKGDKKCKIHLVHGRLNESEMQGLYRHPKIKAFATATHGEGFGMPIFEAVCSELPVVATDWSGHLDFLTMPDENGKDKKMFAKVDFELKQIEPHHVWPGVMEANSGWAFPTSTSLRAKLREAYKDNNRFKSWAKKLAIYNKEKFNKQKVYDMFYDNFNANKIHEKVLDLLK
jgi:glycosyltransferase involved in cell wall biosynthesis